LAVVTIQESFSMGHASWDRGSAIKLWDVEKGEATQTLAESPLKGLAFQHIAFSPDGKAIAATVTEEVRLPNGMMIQDVVKVWDANTLALKQTLGAGSFVFCFALSPDGKLVATGDYSKKVVELWNTDTGARQRVVNIVPRQPLSVAFLPDSKRFVVSSQLGGGSGEITRWDATTGELKHSLKQAALAFSPDGKRVATSDGGELIQLQGIENGEVIASLKVDKHNRGTVAFSPDGKLVAVAGRDGKVRLWNLETGELDKTLEGHSTAVYSLAFSPDGKTLASASQDRTVRLWPINERAAEPK
jgi:WD40 repeat protein